MRIGCLKIIILIRFAMLTRWISSWQLTKQKTGIWLTLLLPQHLLSELIYIGELKSELHIELDWAVTSPQQRSASTTSSQKYWALLYFMANHVALYNFMGYGTFTHSFISHFYGQERYDPFENKYLEHSLAIWSDKYRKEINNLDVSGSKRYFWLTGHLCLSPQP